MGEAGGVTVLCVDDDATMLRMFSRSLSREYEVVTAAGAREGLAFLEGGRSFGVVVSDVEMPDMGGVEFLQRVSRLSPQTSLILLSGRADSESALATASGLCRFLLKPCPPAVLRTTVAEAAERYRARLSPGETPPEPA